MRPPLICLRCGQNSHKKASRPKEWMRPRPLGSWRRKTPVGGNREGVRRTTGVMRCKRDDPDVNETLALAPSQQPVRPRPSVACAAKILWEILQGSVTHHRYLDRS